MLQIIDCIRFEHDHKLVMLAALLCLAGMASSMMVAGRAMTRQVRHVWVALLSLCFTATAWSTHFIAILAFQTSLNITYDPQLTLLSFLLGLAFVGAGFTLVAYQRKVLLARCIGGVLVAVGVVALHYTGMQSLQFQGSFSYTNGLLISSVLAALFFGVSAFAIGFGRQPFQRLSSGLLLVCLVVSLHFTGMGALELDLQPESHNTVEGISNIVLLMAVIVASLVIVVIGMASAIVDAKVSVKLRTEAERFKALSDGAFEGLIVHSNFIIVDANLAAHKLFGFPDDVEGYSIEHWPLVVLNSESGDECVEEIELKGGSGNLFPAEICRRGIRLSSGRMGEMIAVRDLTLRKASEAKITHLALHDALTDLPNRRFFTELANNAVVSAERTGSTFALLALDLDNFKFVNDSHGHASGDQLICAIAERMQRVLRGRDVGARLGGDEFAILDTDTQQPEHALQIARRLHDELKVPVQLHDAEVMVNVSIGIAIYPTDGDNIDTLLLNADTAMYQAKQSGKATTRFFESHMNTELEVRRKLESKLRNAVQQEQLTVSYQPLVDSHDMQVVCFEALLRWHDDELGHVSPVDFIPVAESTGIIIQLGEFVLKQACLDAVSWTKPVRVAVNLSVAQFGREGLVNAVKNALDESGLPGERLELEITESLLIDNRLEALRILTELQQLGIRIAMDDFGTGYSSLSYLQSFAFNKLKIDRAFVSNLENNPQNAGIVQAVVSMGRSLKMKVVAEGVETPEQAAILADLACDELQGYLISKPIPSKDVQAFLTQYTDLPSNDTPIDKKCA